MPHNSCVPLCCKKEYRTVVVDGKEAKVTFHNYPDQARCYKKRIKTKALDFRQLVVMLHGKRLASYLASYTQLANKTIATLIVERHIHYGFFIASYMSYF